MTATPGTAPAQRVTIQKLDKDNNPDGAVIEAQFNPTSLQYSITNSAAQGSDKARSRTIEESTGKLTMELVYDTTDNGEDVRNKTQPIAMLMKPGAGRQTSILDVRWGDFKFRGVLDSYRETIDFFSPEGRPLRAALSLGFSTVVEQNRTADDVFAFASSAPAIDDAGGFQATDRAFTYEVPTFAGTPTSQPAAAMGAPGLGNHLAALNGIEDLRNGAGLGGVLLVVDEPILDEPLGFAAGASADGATAAAAAVLATAAGGAFAGLRLPPAPPRERFDVRRVLDALAVPCPPIEDPVGFGPGGVSLRTGGSTVDVGQRASLRDLIEFED